MGFLNTAEPCGSGPSVNGREGAAEALGKPLLTFAQHCVQIALFSVTEGAL